MPEPNDAQVLPQTAALGWHPTGRLIPTSALVELLVMARSDYDWPSGTGAKKSQQTVRDLEASVAERLVKTGLDNIHSIVIDVSQWASNNAPAHANIVSATRTQQLVMQKAISNLGVSGHQAEAIDDLCTLPGISMVIASKIYRFCLPSAGAAVDRHASYFFNSLPVGKHAFASHFKREWSTGNHTVSRLATYTSANLRKNLSEYIEQYLPLLAKIANELNMLPAPYRCAVTDTYKKWTRADVEMAAYYWWASHGSK
jgi:hypothetical protein